MDRNVLNDIVNILCANIEKGRTDVVAPDPDCIRKDGFIVSVPGFVR